MRLIAAAPRRGVPSAPGLDRRGFGGRGGSAAAPPGPVPGGLADSAFALVIVATSLYLLERLEPVLRPLLIAVLLSYLFLPAYKRLRRYMCRSSRS